MESVARSIGCRRVAGISLHQRVEAVELDRIVVLQARKIEVVLDLLKSRGVVDADAIERSKAAQAELALQTKRLLDAANDQGDAAEAGSAALEACCRATMLALAAYV